MTKEEEILDSLETCRDIYLYYKKNDTKIPENVSSIMALNKETYQKREKISQSAMFLGVRAEKKEKLTYRLFLFLFCIFAAFLAARLFSHFVIQQTKVEGISMENTLHDGEYLFINKLVYRFHDPERFDIVVFPHGDTYYIKRVIGLPGETIQISEGYIYINGELLEEDYGNQLITFAGIAEHKITLSENEYFVMGDNRNNSVDSRFESVGTIQRASILGKAFFRLLPLDKMGKLH